MLMCSAFPVSVKPTPGRHHFSKIQRTMWRHHILPAGNYFWVCTLCRRTTAFFWLLPNLWNWQIYHNSGASKSSILSPAVSAVFFRGKSRDCCSAQLTESIIWIKTIILQQPTGCLAPNLGQRCDIREVKGYLSQAEGGGRIFSQKYFKLQFDALMSSLKSYPQHCGFKGFPWSRTIFLFKLSARFPNANKSILLFHHYQFYQWQFAVLGIQLNFSCFHSLNGICQLV